MRPRLSTGTSLIDTVRHLAALCVAALACCTASTLCAAPPPLGPIVITGQLVGANTPSAMNVLITTSADSSHSLTLTYPATLNTSTTFGPSYAVAIPRETFRATAGGPITMTFQLTDASQPASTGCTAVDLGTESTFPPVVHCVKGCPVLPATSVATALISQSGNTTTFTTILLSKAGADARVTARWNPEKTPGKEVSGGFTLSPSVLGGNVLTPSAGDPNPSSVWILRLVHDDASEPDLYRRVEVQSVALSLVDQFPAPTAKDSGLTLSTIAPLAARADGRFPLGSDATLTAQSGEYIGMELQATSCTPEQLRTSLAGYALAAGASGSAITSFTLDVVDARATADGAWASAHWLVTKPVTMVAPVLAPISAGAAAPPTMFCRRLCVFDRTN